MTLDVIEAGWDNDDENEPAKMQLCIPAEPYNKSLIFVKVAFDALIRLMEEHETGGEYAGQRVIIVGTEPFHNQELADELAAIIRTLLPAFGFENAVETGDLVEISREARIQHDAKTAEREKAGKELADKLVRELFGEPEKSQVDLMRATILEKPTADQERCACPLCRMRRQIDGKPEPESYITDDMGAIWRDTVEDEELWQVVDKVHESFVAEKRIAPNIPKPSEAYRLAGAN